MQSRRLGAPVRIPSRIESCRSDLAYPNNNDMRSCRSEAPVRMPKHILVVSLRHNVLLYMSTPVASLRRTGTYTMNHPLVLFRRTVLYHKCNRAESLRGAGMYFQGVSSPVASTFCTLTEGHYSRAASGRCYEYQGASSRVASTYRTQSQVHSVRAVRINETYSNRFTLLSCPERSRNEHQGTSSSMDSMYHTQT